jgi:hypothetical protein
MFIARAVPLTVAPEERNSLALLQSVGKNKAAGAINIGLLRSRLSAIAWTVQLRLSSDVSAYRSFLKFAVVLLSTQAVPNERHRQTEVRRTSVFVKRCTRHRRYNRCDQLERPNLDPKRV